MGNIRQVEEKYLRGLFKGSIFHSPAPTKSKGVLIGISNKLNWETRIFLKDEEG